MTEAFETLVDPVRRRAYDASGRRPPPAGPAAPAFAGFDFSLAVQGADASTFGDLFVDVIRHAAHGRGGPGPQRGADAYRDVTIALSEVLHGTICRVDLRRQAPCARCHGAGVIDGSPTTCRRCGGSGQHRLGRGHMVFVRPCEACGGVGRVQHVACAACSGAGQQDLDQTVTVPLPPGMADGEEYVVAGGGHGGVRGGAAGDLRLRIRVRPEPHVTRVGDDLHMTVPVAVHEAVLGARIEVPTLDGPVSVRVPPGMPSEQRLRLRDRGVPSRRTGRRGDLVIGVQMVLPPVLDARGRELMREFARLHPEDVRAAWRVPAATVEP
ncbi:MAG: molecular chaperone DnaJ [Acidobacteria bacterium]|nr:molecular chaperone DnaJ [Acidobacteriota bacterium]